MTSLTITSAKLNIVLPAGKLPDVDPNDPTIRINLEGLTIVAKVTAKATRKLKTHSGAAILQGKLVMERGGLVLADAGFQFLEPKPVVADQGEGRGSS